MTADDIGALLDTLCYMGAIVYVTRKLVRLIYFGTKNACGGQIGRLTFLLAITLNSYYVVSYWYGGSGVRCGLAAVFVVLCSAHVYVTNYQIDKRKAVK